MLSVFLLLLVVAAVVALLTIVQPVRAGAVTSSRSVDPARLEADVRRLTEGFSPRDSTADEQLDGAAAWLKERFAETGGIVSEHTFEVTGSTYRNVIARFGPEAGERVIVGAHYDAAGAHPGADDNASGVAGLLELARSLGESPPKGRVDLVAFTLEERAHFGEALTGSDHYAQSLIDAKVPVKAMFSLEMIGFFSDAPGSQRFPAQGLGLIYPTTGDFITVVGKFGEGWLARRVKRSMREASTLPVHSINAPASLRGVDFSDHRSFWIRDLPAVMITDTAFFRNPNYHTENDTPQTLDYVRMAQVVEGVERAVRDLASD